MQVRTGRRSSGDQLCGCYWEHVETQDVVLGLRKASLFPLRKMPRSTRMLRLERLNWQASGMNGPNARIYSGTFSVASAETLAQDSSINDRKADLLLYFKLHRQLAIKRSLDSKSISLVRGREPI